VQNLALVCQIESIPDSALVCDWIEPGSDGPKLCSYPLHVDLQVVSFTNIGRTPGAPQQLFVRHNVRIALHELGQQLNSGDDHAGA